MIIHRKKLNKGFTLVEILVAIGIFSLIMVTSSTALLSVVAANKKAQAMKSVVDNLNVALESMSRAARVGTGFGCGVGESPAAHGTNCTGGGHSFIFASQKPGIDIRYDIKNIDGIGAITRTEITGGVAGPEERLTAPEVNINVADTWFYVTNVGSAGNQPRVTMFIHGTAASGTANETDFNIQTTISQRMPEII